MYILELTRGVPCLSENNMLGIFENDQAKALSALGNKVVVLGVDLRSIRRKRKFGLTKTKENGIAYYQYSFPLGKSSLFLRNKIGFWCFKKAVKTIEKENGKPDLIHAHFANSVGYWAYLAHKKMGFDYVVTEHSSQFDIGQKFSKNLTRAMKKVYQNSLGNIAVSQDYAIALSKKFDVPFECIPNIVDDYFFRLEIKKPDALSFNFLFIGNLVPSKACSILLAAFSRFKENHPSSSLSIIGDGRERKQLVRQAEQFNLGESVAFIGQIKRQEMGDYLKKAACFVLPSYHETFGVVYVEAMASGLPVIATRCGGPNRIVNDQNGLFCEIGSQESLLNAMEKIYQNIDLYDKKAIRNYAYSRFSSSIVGKELESFLKKALLKVTK